MYNLRKPLLLTGLSISLLSCLDHRGFPPENDQRMRLKRRDREVLDSPRYVSRLEVTYDLSGRLVEVHIAGSENNAPFIPVYYTLLTYDGQGKLLKETYFDGPGNTGVKLAATYTYEYDSLNRVSRVLKNGNKIDQILTYDAQNRVSRRIAYSYQGDSLIGIGSDSYEFDSRNNIPTAYRITPPFRYKMLATFDQAPNPTYQLITRVLHQLATGSSFNTPNGIVGVALRRDVGPPKGGLRGLGHTPTTGYSLIHSNHQVKNCWMINR